MKIIETTLYPVHELVERLRRVTMLHDGAAYPYAEADISVTDIDTADMSPPQTYILQREFEKVRLLRWRLLEHGIDLLRLADTKIADGKVVRSGGQPLGFLTMLLAADRSGEEDGAVVTLLPPVIEEITEADGRTYRVICDGQHRCYLSRVCRMVPAVVRIAKLPPHYPYYAYPLPGGWGDVRMVEEIGRTMLKKFHRIEDYKTLYRNYNSVFENVGGPRGRDK